MFAICCLLQDVNQAARHALMVQDITVQLVHQLPCCKMDSVLVIVALATFFIMATAYPESQKASKRSGPDSVTVFGPDTGARSGPDKK